MLLTQHNHSSSLFVLYNTTSWTILSSHLSVSHTFCLFLFLSLSLPLGHSNLTKLQLTAWPPELADSQRQRQMTVMIYSGSRVLQRWRIWGSCQRKKKKRLKWQKLWRSAHQQRLQRHRKTWDNVQKLLFCSHVTANSLFDRIAEKTNVMLCQLKLMELPSRL